MVTYTANPLTRFYHKMFHYILQIDCLPPQTLNRIHLYLDLNECVQFLNICHQNANCTNNEGSYSCKCLQGYSGDGILNCSGKLCYYG